jgi:hypothetical protein
LMKGFFSVNPEITRHESTSPSDVSNWSRFSSWEFLFFP